MKDIDTRSLRKWSIILVLIMVYLVFLRDRDFMSALLVASVVTAGAIILEMLHKSEHSSARFIGVVLDTILMTMVFTVVLLFVMYYLADISSGWLPLGIALVVGLGGGVVYGMRQWRKYKLTPMK